MKYLVTGKNGQLGKEFIKRLTIDSKDFVAVGHDELDISNLKNVISVFDSVKPNVVINTAAYNLVDLAEKQYVQAYRTNSLGVSNLLFAGEIYNSFLVHYSSDYVFDGTKDNGLYTEEDEANPVSEYGKSKYMGETFIKENSLNSLLFRTSWVFGEGKQNFIYKFLEWTKNNKILKISSDEVSIPTSTGTIAELTLKALENRLTGTYHLTNSGYCSRYEFAKYIAGYMKLDNIIYPVTIDSFNLPARRPKFGAMANLQIAKALETEIPVWSEAVAAYLKAL